MVFWANQNSLIKLHTKKAKQKQKTKLKESFAKLTEKYLKIEEYKNI